MNVDISAIRTDYQQKSLTISDVLPNPVKQFENWFQEAINASVVEPNAMNLATVNDQGKPSSRIVLLKGIIDNAFQFYTNYNSNKGIQMAQNPFAALTFFWPELERQIRIEGKVSKVTDQESSAYFSSRPKGSKIGAWASPQSQEIESRLILENKVEALNKEFPSDDIPRPSHWGGYKVVPDHIEFWQGRKSRLHDRIAYFLNKGNWEIKRLAP